MKAPPALLRGLAEKWTLNMTNNRNTAHIWALATLLVSAPCLDAIAATPAHASQTQLVRHIGVKHHAQSFQEGIEIIDGTTGNVVVSVNDKALFNPASNTKLATALIVLENFGAEYRFDTEIRTNGVVDETGVLQGDLIVRGHYMLFGDRQAHELVKALNDRGIKGVSGNLYVASDFTMNLQATGAHAANKLMNIIDPQHQQLKRLKGRHKTNVLAVASSLPAVRILGKLKIGSPAGASTLLITHHSPPVRDVLKIMLCYSDNTMAERFGALFGGPKGLKKFLVNKIGIPANEVKLVSTSGLGINRISPRAMMHVLMALKAELVKQILDLQDLLAVSGIDDGTMKKRLNEPGEAGSVIAKTGTLPETDRGVSTLSGQFGTTSDGAYLFVIFEMHGDVLGFRERQNKMVSDFQIAHGGAKPIVYTPILPRIDGEDFWN